MEGADCIIERNLLFAARSDPGPGVEASVECSYVTSLLFREVYQQILP